jgi:hypothetical protein
MSYAELVESILKDLKKEIGASFVIRVAKVDQFELARKSSKKSKHISTYKEINSLFQGASFVPHKHRRMIGKIVMGSKRIKLTIPYLGKVS